MPVVNRDSEIVSMAVKPAESRMKREACLRHDPGLIYRQRQVFDEKR